MKRNASIFVCTGMVACAFVKPVAAQEPKFASVTLSAKADLGEATFSYSIELKSGSANVAMQLFLHRDDATKRDQWDTVSPTKPDGAPLIVSLSEGTPTSGKFVVALKRGVYGKYRLLLFRSPDGKSIDYNKMVFDSVKDPKLANASLNMTIKTESKRIKTPVLYLPSQVRDVQMDSDGAYVVNIAASVKVPANYSTADKGFWAMAKGDGGFSQVWCALDSAMAGGNVEDPYQIIPIQFTIKNPKAGLWNLQFGLFKQGFGDPIEWVWPGLDYETGGDKWVVRAPASSVPPRLRVEKRQFVTLTGEKYDFYRSTPEAKSAVSFVRGGNYGNRVVQTVKPALDDPAYFKRLNALGCRYMRVNFNQNRYPNEPLYQHVVDQIAQNIWAAGMYPILCPQGLPDANTLDDQADKGLKVVQALATHYKGKSAWLEICNEPHEFSTWESWKPVAIRYVKAIREIDPNAFVIVPFEGLGKDGRAAAKDPITESTVHVDLYDGHAYVDPGMVEKLYAPDIEAGLPLLIGEYGGGADYLAKMDRAFEKLPTGLMAMGPWAFTIAGEDSLPLVADGNRDPLTFTPSGQVIADDFAAWNHGKKRGE